MKAKDVRNVAHRSPSIRLLLCVPGYVSGVANHRIRCFQMRGVDDSVTMFVSAARRDVPVSNMAIAAMMAASGQVDFIIF